MNFQERSHRKSQHTHKFCTILFQMDITEESCLDLFPPETVIYLTPDAEEGLICLGGINK